MALPSKCRYSSCCLYEELTIDHHCFCRFITPWVEKSGFVPPIMTNKSLVTLWCLFGFLFYFKGKTFRRWSRNSNVHSL
jgi:hypothetical protein